MKKLFPILLTLLLAISGQPAGAGAPGVIDPAVAHPYGKEFPRLQFLATEVAAATELDVVFIGDSITHYWQTRGRKVWQEKFSKLNVLNLGIEGDKTYNVLWRLQEYPLRGAHPKVAVVLIGTNNIGLSKQSGAMAAKGVEAVVAHLRKTLPDTRILLLGLFPRAGWPGQQAQLANAEIKNLDDGEHVFYRDIGSIFLLPDGEIDISLMHDKLHLTEEGYRKWADALLPEIQRLLEL